MNGPIFRRFHRDIVTLKAHHWKYWFDLYSGCAHNCQYCLYRRDESFSEDIRPLLSDPVRQLKEALQRLSDVKGIFYLGATSDIYQPIERETRQARQTLQLFFDLELPIVLGTKSPLILRDLDILEAMARRNLVEVSITIISLDPAFARFVEVGAPTIEERLETARELSSFGIPVNFHVAPLIPNYFNDYELVEFVSTLRDTGAVGMYSCILGIRRAYRQSFFDSMMKLNPSLARYLESVYISEEKTHAALPFEDIVLKEMTRLRDVCCQAGFDFFCEHIPAFDSRTRTGGIFGAKLPTTGDMYRYLVSLGKEEYLQTDLIDFTSQFPSADSSFTDLVLNEWQAGRLFEGTYLHPYRVGDNRLACEQSSDRSQSVHHYYLTSQLDTSLSEVLTCE